VLPDNDDPGAELGKPSIDNLFHQLDETGRRLMRRWKSSAAES